MGQLFLSVPGKLSGTSAQLTGEGSCARVDRLIRAKPARETLRQDVRNQGDAAVRGPFEGFLGGSLPPRSG